MAIKWRSWLRLWHINLGLFATLTLGLIAVSCFFMAPGQQRGDIGRALKEIHEGKFLPEGQRWVWIYGQGGLLGWLILSGFMLHRKAKKRLNPSAPDQPGSCAVVLFGSETGNSESVARRLGERAEAVGLRAFVAPMDAFDAEQLREERWLLVVTSTYGDGEMPSNAARFWQALRSPSMGRLPRLEFAVLGLGDTNYEQFCAAGKALDARLEELGARRMLPRVDCDTDYEAGAARWIEEVVSRLAGGRTVSEAKPEPKPDLSGGSLEVVGAVANSARQDKPAVGGEAYSKSNPYPAVMVENRRLTANDFGKEVRHYQIDLNGSGVAYRTGDALGVYPSNCQSLVELTLAAAGFHGEEGVRLRGGRETSLRQALTHHLDITKPGRSFLEAVAARSKDARLSELLAAGNEGAVRDYLAGREVVDVLREWRPTFAAQDFADALKPLAPRLYSIASSAVARPRLVDLTVATVRYEAHGLPRRGVCSTFLAERVRGVSPMPVFVQGAGHFRLPQDGSRPVIMVGPGTGIAPFRAFLEERENTGAPGHNWLFFGCQNSQADFLYREELEGYHHRGVLNRLHTAFSREGAEKVYVQHRMLEHGRELWAWLQDGAYFYVCGDASRMARDVHAALQQIAMSHGGLTEQAAEDFLSQLKSEKRYLRDVY